MKDEIKEYLEDILREACEIKEFTVEPVVQLERVP